MQNVLGNRYRILRTLGKGGMGRVYLAHDEVLDREVALKVLYRDLAEHEDFVERFKREARSAASLSHPNIVSVHDLGVTGDGSHFIAMEYVSGGTLEYLLKREGFLPPERARRIAAQIASALGAAHERGVIHRDVKPQNVLLTGSGDAKVADFGIARAAALTTLTGTGFVLGTARYISPEQARGEPVGPPSDLYSLGIVLYEMLTGEVPFDAETPIGLAMKHMSDVPRPPKEANPAVPDDLNDLVMRLLSKAPEERPKDASALIDELEGTSSGEAATVPGPSRDATAPMNRRAAGRTGATRAHVPPPVVSPSGTAASGVEAPHPFRRVWAALVVGILAVLLAGGIWTMAPSGLGLGGGLLGEADAPPSPGASEPPQEKRDPGSTPPAPDDAGSELSPAGKDPPASDEPEDPTPAETSAEQEFVSDYYEAVAREDWQATYSMLDRTSRAKFSEQEWVAAQEARVAATAPPPVQYAVIKNLRGDAAGATITVVLGYADGTEEILDIQVSVENGEIKRHLTEEEISYLRSFMGERSPGLGEEAAVENAIRAHYRAIGAGDFDEAYSYFGPTFRATISREDWIADEESFDIRSSRVNSVAVEEVSGDTATATVDVAFADNTGTPRFVITWSLVKEDGRWKLDEIIHGQRVG
ncbi:serine/threonine protein kinase [Rubrobacter xylanophilus DSM 9941]|uniref:non-specific serine/threonine protein kinase n=1 Tax=Rubrobacter xylanophilus (strain DSM 9941 / JCM 11954 / NBRC 16129 / PRD-1) TaxID=266117 RepID=Q1ATR6_RUBXD|nr:protein kinase [Rubrobacter xylanophilus]ABG05212.1 serine/threonine protein kinase [Rubrobacter xylanophilus DSM 9941]